MQLPGLLELLREAQPYRDLLAALRRSDDPLALGVLRSARPFVAAALARDWGAPVVYVTTSIARAYNVSEQLPVWLGDAERITRFGEPAPVFYERAPWGEPAVRSRIETLATLMPPEDTPSDSPPVVVTSARALMQRTLPVNQFRKGSVLLKRGAEWQMDKLLDRWVKLGYEPVSMVIEPGTFSRRGGIVDVFPLALDQPVRIEFFGDEIDSLRRFDVSTQRSTEKIDRVVITPAREALPEHTPPLAAALREWFAGLPPTETDVTSPQADEQPLSTGVAFPFIEHYLPYLYPNPISLLDYAPDNALIVVEDGGELRDAVAEIEEHAARTRAEKVAAGILAPDHPVPFIGWDVLERGDQRTLRRLSGAFGRRYRQRDVPRLNRAGACASAVS